MATNYEKWLEIGTKLSYTAGELRDFVTQKQAEKREETASAQGKQVWIEETRKFAQRMLRLVGLVGNYIVGLWCVGLLFIGKLVELV